MKKQDSILQKYIRIYDTALINKYNSIKSSKRSKVSDNEFLNEIISLGLGCLQPSDNEVEITYKNTQEIKRLLTTFISEFRKFNDIIMTSKEIDNKKMNCLLNIVIAKSLGEDVSHEEIESGMYDDTDERFLPKKVEGDDE